MTPQANEEAKQNAALRLLPITRNFPFFAGISLLFGLVYTFCLYENPCGITYPLFTLFAGGCGVHLAYGRLPPSSHEQLCPASPGHCVCPASVL